MKCLSSGICCLKWVKHKNADYRNMHVLKLFKTPRIRNFKQVTDNVKRQKFNLRVVVAGKPCIKQCILPLFSTLYNTLSFLLIHIPQLLFQIIIKRVLQLAKRFFSWMWLRCLISTKYSNCLYYWKDFVCNFWFWFIVQQVIYLIRLRTF